MSYFTSTGDAAALQQAEIDKNPGLNVSALPYPGTSTGATPSVAAPGTLIPARGMVAPPPESMRTRIINAEQWLVAYRWPIGGALTGGLLVYLLMKHRK